MNLSLSRKYLSVGLIVFACWQMGQGAYIYAKAQLAQYLIASAWEKSDTNHYQVKPWSWSDMWPVAKLVVAEHEIEQYVLSGVSGESLAFGPGHMHESATPVARGNTILAAHRDTHFAFLQYVKVGEVMSVINANGEQRDYVVQDMTVVDKNDVDWIDVEGHEYQLSLVTCYPFNGIVSGGDLRFVVRAVSQAGISA